jgi:hypothetical protein
MKFNISKKWLLKAASKEDKMPVSAGAFTFDMVADNFFLFTQRSSRASWSLSIL